MSPINRDLRTVSRALSEVERDARELPWAHERPWTVATHLGSSGGVPLVDLHGLSVRLGLRVLHHLNEADLQTGGCILITGRGKHTGGHSKLRTAVRAKLETMEGCRSHPLGPGRLDVTFDSERRALATGGLGWLFWLFVAVFLLAVAVTLYDGLR